MSPEHPVIVSLRHSLAHARDERKLADEIGGRIQQLISGMVDGTLLPAAAAAALLEAVYAFVRREALPTLARRDPESALRLLKKIAAYAPWTHVDLAEEAPPLEAAAAAKYPPPEPPSWPVIQRLRELAARAPHLCTLGAPAANVAFVRKVEEEGGALPEEIVALYGAFDGLDLSAASSPGLPVFSMLPARSLDVDDREGGRPRRVTVFQGGDEVELFVHRDRKKAWWCTYAYEHEPVAKRALDVPDLLAFGLQRAEAADVARLERDLSWETYFNT